MCDNHQVKFLSMTAPDQDMDKDAIGSDCALKAICSFEAVCLIERRRSHLLLQNMVQLISLEQLKVLTLKYFAKEPRVVYDRLYMAQHRQNLLPSAGLPAVPWCTRGNCKDLPTDQERICCGQILCTSRLPQLSLYCMDAGLLRIHTGRTCWLLSKLESLGQTTGSTVLLPTESTSFGIQALQVCVKMVALNHIFERC